MFASGFEKIKISVPLQKFRKRILMMKFADNTHFITFYEKDC